jgi:hypothetical protein
MALAASCRAAGVAFDIRPAPPRGTWEANCAYKATFLHDMWRERRQPLLWVDADARVQRPPDLLRGTSADFAIHKVQRWQFASGTLFFNATPLAGVLLATWERLCLRYPHVLDQLLLDAAWETTMRDYPLATMWLPTAYTSIFDHPEAIADDEAPVIVHLQASRRLKSAVSQMAAPRPAPDVPEPWRAARRASRAWINASGSSDKSKTPPVIDAISQPDFAPLPGTPHPLPAAFTRYDARIRRTLGTWPEDATRVAIFGASWFGARVAAQLRAVGREPIAFFDNSAAGDGQTFMGIPVRAPGVDALADCDAVIVASIEHGRAIEAQLRLLTAGFRRVAIVAAHRRAR